MPIPQILPPHLPLRRHGSTVSRIPARLATSQLRRSLLFLRSSHPICLYAAMKTESVSLVFLFEIHLFFFFERCWSTPSEHFQLKFFEIFFVAFELQTFFFYVGSNLVYAVVTFLRVEILCLLSSVSCGQRQLVGIRAGNQAVLFWLAQWRIQDKNRRRALMLRL